VTENKRQESPNVDQLGVQKKENNLGNTTLRGGGETMKLVILLLNTALEHPPNEFFPHQDVSISDPSAKHYTVSVGYSKSKQLTKQINKQRSLWSNSGKREPRSCISNTF